MGRAPARAPSCGTSPECSHSGRSLGCGRSGRTPILLLAPDLAGALVSGDVASMREFAVEQLTREFGPVIEHDLSEGSAYVLVDAIDEVGDCSRAAPTRGRGPQVRCRPSERPGTGDDAAGGISRVRTRLSVRACGDTAAQRGADRTGSCARGWRPLTLRGIRERATPVRTRSCRRSARVARLKASPRRRCYSRVIALLARQGGTLPARQVELLRVATRTLVRQWPLSKGFDLSEYEMLVVMGRIGRRIVSSGGGGLTLTALHQVIEKAIGDLRGLDGSAAGPATDAMLRALEQQTGFLVEAGSNAGRPTYSFIHRTFAEYLAALDAFEDHMRGRRPLESVAFGVLPETVVEMFFWLAADRSKELSTRLLLELLEVRPPLEAYLHRGLVLCLKLLAAGIPVRSSARNHVLRAAALEILTAVERPDISRLTRPLVQATAAVPAGTDTRKVLEQIDPAIGTAIRRAAVRWCLSAYRPNRDDERAAIEAVRAGLAASDLEALDLLRVTIGTIAGDAGIAPSSAPDDWTDWILLMGNGEGESGLFAQMDPVVGPLVEAGIGTCSIEDLVLHDGAPAGLDPRLVLVDTGHADTLTSGDLAHLVSITGMQPVVEYAVQGRSWTADDAAWAIAKVREIGAHTTGPDTEPSESWGTLFAPAIMRAGVDALAGDLPVWLELVMDPDVNSSVASQLAASVLVQPCALVESAWGHRFVVAMLRHPSVDVRAIACRSILMAEIGVMDATGKGTRLAESIVGALIDLTRDPEPRVQGEAWRASGLSWPLNPWKKPSGQRA